MLQSPNGRLRPVRDLNLPQDRFHVNLDRSFGNVACTRDGLVGRAFHETVENLSLALRQPGAVVRAILVTARLCGEGTINRRLGPRHADDVDRLAAAFSAVR